ncbi:MAG: methionyl-tRNA formyltransferase [Alphaproteobacteria bacterium]|nr:methionyl-tRNA formyltransferase [Alphaproteobacteria bacterium]
MSIIIITGDHPRHKYLVNCIASTGCLAAWVQEKRESFVPEPPQNIAKDLKYLFVKHFALRDEVENQFFNSNDTITDAPILQVSASTLNADKTVNFVNHFAPKIILSYGCHKLSKDFMQNVNSKFWNIHGGLSPDYRGTITHFWPRYFLEPQMTGMTLHETTDFLDAGAIILQTAAAMNRGDSLHMLASRNVMHFCEILKSKISQMNMEQLPQGIIQKNYGKVFMSSDWRVEHLHLIYNLYHDRIVDAVLDGHIKGREPELIEAI